MRLYFIFFVTLIFSHGIKAEHAGFIQAYDSFNSNGKLINSSYNFTPLPETKPLIIIPSTLKNIAKYVNPSSIPFYKIAHTARYGDEVIYDVTYEGSDFGFRIIPEFLYSKNTTKHLIIAGDSNTFGQGVNIEDTLPVRLAKHFAEYRPYNFGIRGGAPNNMLALMDFFPWEKLIKESEGLFIYNYQDYILERIIGGKNFMQWSHGTTPYYELDAQDIPIYRGNFNDSTFTRNILTKFFNFVGSYDWLNKLLPVLPRYHYQQSFLTAKIFLKMYNHYKETFPKGTFIVVLNEYIDNPSEHLKDLQTELTKNKVPFVVISREWYNQKLILLDHHLNVRGHTEEERQFLKVLSLNKIIR